MHQLIHPIHRNAAHPALLRQWMICNQKMAVRIAVRAIPLMRRRAEKSDDWYMDGVCDVEWTGVARNVERRHFFKSGEF